MVTRSSVADRLAGVAIGLMADRALGEPPAPAHPVALFGGAMERLERRWWRDDRWRGALYAATGVGAATSTGWLVERVTGPRTAVMGATALCAAAQALTSEAEAIGALLEEGELDAARARLPNLVGRDPDSLDHNEMARAVVESVAENLSDAVVGTAWWAAAAGAPGALAHRAANTLDAMVGHRNPRHRRFGWAAARLDDVLGWPAARLTALLVIAVRPAQVRQISSAVRRDAPRHPSPNAGVAEAAFAGALGLGLGGSNSYGGRVEDRPPLGSGRPAGPEDIGRAVALARDVTGLLVVICAAGAVLAGRRPSNHAGQVRAGT